MMDFFDVFLLLVLAAFYLVFLSRALVLWRRGVRVFALSAARRKGTFFLDLSFAFGLPVWSAGVVLHSLRLPLPSWLEPFFRPLFAALPLQVLGALLILAGLAVFLLSLAAFGESWRVGIDDQCAGRLITTGIFSVTRNPIFLFVDLYFLGTWLVRSNLFFLFFFCVVAAGMHVQVLREEAFLRRHYGAPYLAYARRVRRYL